MNIKLKNPFKKSKKNIKDVLQESFINKQSKKLNKKLIFRVILVLTILITLIVAGLKFKERLDNITVEDMKISVYYSKGSRDTQKQLKDTYLINDPIQAQIEFKNAKDGTTLTYQLRFNNEILNEFAIPISGTSNRFITVNPPGATLKPGEYNIVLLQKGFEITSKQFKVN